MKYNVILSSIIFLVVSSLFAFEMNELPIIPGADYTGYKNYLEDTPPEIKRVVITPTEVTANDEVEVKVTIFNDPDKTDATVTEVILFYSIDDGKTYKEIPMEQDEKLPQIWYCKIPPQEKGTKVMFYIQAYDTENNYVVEIPQKIFKEKWPADEEFILTSIDEDEKEETVTTNMDILKTFIAHDKEYLYFKLQFQDNITDGTLDPPYLHTYLVNILNLDHGLSILKSYLLGYMPHMRVTATYPECFFYDIGRISFIYDAGNVCKIDKNTLYLKVKKESLGKKLEKGLKLTHLTCAATTLQLTKTGSGVGTIATTATAGLIEFLEHKVERLRGKITIELEDIDDIRGVVSFQDLTPYSIIYLRSHSYEVKE